jgi:TolB-like protein
MAGDVDVPGPSLATDTRERLSREKKARHKLRSAWISFVGRILAQVIGAAATVALGLLIAERMQRPAPSEPSSAAAPAVEGPPPRTDGLSLAVLPLDNFSGDAAHEHLADGLTEALIADLARLRAFHVVSRTSVMPYKGARRPLPGIARELGVDVVIEGSVVLSGRRVRVNAQLVDARQDRHLWAESYDRELGDVLALQSDVARRVARAVHLALDAGAPPAGLAGGRPLDPARGGPPVARQARITARP